jgi:hypothetical protein
MGAGEISNLRGLAIGCSRGIARLLSGVLCFSNGLENKNISNSVPVLMMDGAEM